MFNTDMYQGPILLIYSEEQQQIEKQVEKLVLTAVQKVGVDVDKNELLKALAYDRGQYEKGRADALASIVRCKECKNRGLTYCPMEYPPEDFNYCSYGERRDTDDTP